MNPADRERQSALEISPVVATAVRLASFAAIQMVKGRNPRGESEFDQMAPWLTSEKLVRQGNWLAWRPKYGLTKML